MTYLCDGGQCYLTLVVFMENCGSYLISCRQSFMDCFCQVLEAPSSTPLSYVYRLLLTSHLSRRTKRYEGFCLVYFVTDVMLRSQQKHSELIPCKVNAQTRVCIHTTNKERTHWSFIPMVDSGNGRFHPQYLCVLVYPLYCSGSGLSLGSALSPADGMSAAH